MHSEKRAKLFGEWIGGSIRVRLSTPAFNSASDDLSTRDFRIELNPACTLMSIAKGFGVDNFREDLQRFQQTRTRAIEKLMPVRNVYLSVLHGLQR